jgi:hypothetical protein
MYNITLRRVPATIVAVEKQTVLHNLSVCICSFRYPAYSAHGPYCHLWPALLHIIIPHYVINGTVSEKSYSTHNVCFAFLYNICLKHLILRINERDTIKKKLYIGLHVKYPLFLSDFNKT